MTRLAVVIGINGYQHGVPRLRNAVRDARAFAKVLRHHGYSRADGTLIELLEQRATHAALLDVLTTRLRAEVTPEHHVIVYFAGHGLAVPDAERVLRGHLLPYDAEPTGRVRYLDMEVVRAALNQLACRHLLVILDCCSAGAFAHAQYREVIVERPLFLQRFEAMQQRRAYQLLASAAHDQQAADSVGPFAAKVAQDRAGRHSPFTAALLDALTPPSNVDRDRDGVVTATQLYDHLRRELAVGGVIQTPNLWPLDWHDNGEFTFLFGEPRFFVPTGLVREDSPYRGSAPFAPSDQRLFFGRLALARTLADTLLATPVVIVTGASGAGKSSLVAAGVVPLLRDRVAVVGPLVVDDPSLAGMTAALASAAVGDRPAVIVLDAVAPTRAGLAQLAEFAATIGDRIHLLLAVRSDVIGEAQRAFPAAPTTTLAPLNRDELRECIERPAADRFLLFAQERRDRHDTVVDALLHEADGPGALALLSIVLDDMFRHCVESRRDDRTLGWADHDAIGGIGAVVRRRAEAIYACADATGAERVTEQATLRDLLRAMVELDPSGRARRTVRTSTLAYDDAAEMVRTRRMLERLVAARLIVIDADHAQLAHDALLDGWSGVDGLDSTRTRLLDRLDAAAHEWRGHGTAGLWADDRLVELRVLVDGDEPLSPEALLARLAPSTLTSTARGFVRASARARRSRRRRTRAVVAIVLTVLAAAAAVSQWQRTVAIAQREVAETQRRIADQRQLENRRLLAMSYLEQGRQLLVDEHRPLAALPYLVAAREAGVDTDALRRLFARASVALPSRVISTPAVDRALADWLDDELILLGSDTGVSAWSITSGRPLAPMIAPADGIYDMAAAPDGSSLLTCAPGAARFWDPRTGAPLGAAIAVPGKDCRVEFSADGGRAVVLGDEPVVIDARTHVAVDRIAWPGAEIALAAMSADGARVAVVDVDGYRLRVWNARTRRLGRAVVSDGTQPALSPDGTWLAAIADDRLALWNTAAMTPRTEHRDVEAPAERAGFVAISADGQRVVASDSIDSNAQIWSSTGAAIATFGAGDVIDVELDRSGELAVTTSQVGLEIWDAVNGHLLAGGYEWRRGEQMMTGISPGHRALIAADNSGSAYVWELREVLPERVAMPGAPDDAIVQIMVCGEGWLVLQSEAREVYTWDRTRLAARAIAHDATVLACDRHDHLALAGPGGVLRLVSIATGDPRPLAVAASASAAAFSLDGERLYAAVAERVPMWSTLRAWSTASGDVVDGFAPEVRVRSYGTSLVTTGDTIAALSDAALVFDTAGAQRSTCRPAAELEGSDRHYYSADARRFVVTVSDPSEVTIWDTATCRQLASIVGLRASAVDAVLSADGALVALVFEDDVQVWDVASGQALTPLLPNRGGTRAVEFAPDASALFTSDQDGGFVTWPLPRDDRDLASWARLVERCDPYTLRDAVLVRRDIDPAACDVARR